MGATRVPGFSAEASLYRSGIQYQSGQLPAGIKQGPREIIEPALKFVNWFCSRGLGLCCLVGGNWHHCYDYDTFWRGIDD